MASMERFDTLLGKADEAAGRALELIPNTNGSERGKLYAAIATMWLETARLELQLVTNEGLTRKIEGYGRRLALIERALKIEAPMPDPFDEEDHPMSAGV